MRAEFVEFARAAAQDLADIRIAVKDWLVLYRALAESLLEKGASPHDIAELFRLKLIGVYLEFHTVMGGQGLAMLDAMASGGSLYSKRSRGNFLYILKQSLFAVLYRRYNCCQTEMAQSST